MNVTPDYPSLWPEPGQNPKTPTDHPLSGSSESRGPEDMFDGEVSTAVKTALAAMERFQSAPYHSGPIKTPTNESSQFSRESFSKNKHGTMPQEGLNFLADSVDKQPQVKQEQANQAQIKQAGAAAAAVQAPVAERAPTAEEIDCVVRFINDSDKRYGGISGLITMPPEVADFVKKHPEIHTAAWVNVKAKNADGITFKISSKSSLNKLTSERVAGGTILHLGQKPEIAISSSLVKQIAAFQQRKEDLYFAVKFIQNHKNMSRIIGVIPFPPDVINFLKLINNLENIDSEKSGSLILTVRLKPTIGPSKITLKPDFIKKLGEMQEAWEDLGRLTFDSPLKRKEILEEFSPLSLLTEPIKGNELAEIAEVRGKALVTEGDQTFSVPGPMQNALVLSYVDKRDGVLYQEYLKVDQSTGKVMSIKTFPSQKGWVKSEFDSIRLYLRNHPGIEFSKFVIPAQI